MKDETRNVYRAVPERHVLRTADVHQTEIEDGVDGYSDTLLAIVANFKNAGAPEGFNAQSMVGKSKRGEVALRLFAVVDDEKRRFVCAGFKARGCLAVTACASAVCTMLEGKTLDEALAISLDDIREVLDGVPANKSYTLYFGVEAIRALVGDYLMRQGASEVDLDEVVPCSSTSIPCIVCEHCSMRAMRIEMALVS